MFHLLKLLVYAGLIAIVIFIVWFVPKYSFIAKNPGFCTELFNHVYYCGNKADIQSLFNK